MTRGTPFQAGHSGNPGGRPKSAELSALARRYTVDAIRGLVAVARLEAARHDSAVTAACRALLDLGYPGHLKGGGGDGEAANVLHLHLLAVAGAPLQGLPQQLQSTTAGLAQLPPENPNPQEPEGPTEEEYLDQLVEDGMLPAAKERLPHEALPLWDRSAHGLAKAQRAIDGNAAQQGGGMVEFGNPADVALNRAIQQGAKPSDYRPPVIGFGE